MNILIKFLLLFSLLAVNNTTYTQKLIVNGQRYAVTYDTDAQAFFTALESDAAPVTLNSSQKGAVNQLVLDLKSSGAWAKLFFLYPCIGGTSAAHKYNVKDPRNLDAAFRLTFGGTITHSATGMQFDGASGYANTHFIPASFFTTSSACLGIYSATNNSIARYDIGSYDGTNLTSMELRWSTDDNFYDLFSATDRVTATGGNLSTRLHIANRSSTTLLTAYRDGISIGTNTLTVSSSPTPTYPLFIGAQNGQGTAAGFSDRLLNLIFASSALTGGEIISVTTAVNTYNTTLGRNF